MCLLILDEDETVTIRAHVESPGYVRMPLRGYIREYRGDGVYIAPLIPQLFYGADGQQLSTWRQHVSQTGDQVILSRSAGEPFVPRQELYWRKVPGKEEAAQFVNNIIGGAVEEIAAAPDYRPLMFLGALLLLFFWGK
jgi:hypothetical protein